MDWHENKDENTLKIHAQNSGCAQKMCDLAGKAEIQDKEMKNFSRDNSGSWALKLRVIKSMEYCILVAPPPPHLYWTKD
jgi:hypothetical protein